jgi:hypothetical protein
VSVLLRIDKYKAILRGGEWRCASTPLEEALNRFTRHWVQREAESGELQSNLEDQIAAAVARRFHGRVGLRLSSQERLNQQRYMDLRQLDLFDNWNS